MRGMLSRAGDDMSWLNHARVLLAYRVPVRL